MASMPHPLFRWAVACTMLALTRAGVCAGVCERTRAPRQFSFIPSLARGGAGAAVHIHSEP